MCGKNFAFLCCELLLVTSSINSQQNFANNEVRDDNLTIRYEVDVESTTIYSDEIKTSRYDLYEKFITDTRYEMQNEFRTISMNNDREDVNSKQYKLDTHFIHNHENDEQMPMKSHMNSINVNHQKNFTLHKVYGNLIGNNDSMSNEDFENSSKDSNKSNIIPYEMCHNITCILFCCPLGDRMRIDDDKCIPEKIKYVFPNVYGCTNDLMQSDKRVDELFQLAVYDSCEGKNRTLLPDGHQYDYMIFANGSIYLSYYKIFAKWTSSCLVVMEEDKFEMTYCSETEDEINKFLMSPTDNASSNFHANIIHVNYHIISILFLLPIFLVYSILPELRNVHGFMLRNYSGALSIANTIGTVNYIIKADDVQYPVCITIAFLNYFFYMSAYFWLSMMSFVMWWTFRGFGSLQRNVKQREKRKFMYYAIYAWGFSFIFAIVCVIMDSVSEYVPKIWRPEFHLGDCWFHNDKAFALYYYGFKSVCIISSVCLSIATALKIKGYEKDTSFRLADSESKRYNNNKKWLILYLKLFIVLFIVMGIKWSVMTVTWIFGRIPEYVWYTTNLVDILQNIFTFIIFVCKKKIKLMIRKRFGCETNATSCTFISHQRSLRRKRRVLACKKTVTQNVRSMGLNSNVAMCKKEFYRRSGIND